MKNTYRILGVMSGTSIDGLDLAICSFNKTKEWNFKIEKCKTVKYTKNWKYILGNLHNSTIQNILKHDIIYAKLIAKEIKKFLKNENVDFIASHGHTIFHQPEKKYTLQIGNGRTIANITRLKTITNFRNLDISLGGQGAPLVPVGDLKLFKNFKYCLNIGGIANISIKEKNKIKAFDICPANIVLNKISRKLKLDFDNEGNLAMQGKIITKLFSKLNSLSYYNNKSPKSLSREWVEKNIDPLILERYNHKDVLHTLCEHMGKQIGQYLKEGKTLVTGGGAFNKYLIERLKNYSNSQIVLPNKKIINFKEAMIFAFLGVLKIRNQNNCLKSVTGAKQNSCGGEINNPM
ncbi:MAG: anhydro-N-acetylmuramic acid kinase [Bacteroidota bacterium]|nr:anhydro-N-acetylmuramic acid kinase [Bacteroidota bacterium]